MMNYDHDDSDDGLFCIWAAVRSGYIGLDGAGHGWEYTGTGVDSAGADVVFFPLLYTIILFAHTFLLFLLTITIYHGHDDYL